MGSEMMLGYLRRGDVSLMDEQAEADVIIANTCAFVLDAKDENVQTVLTAACYKKEGQLKALIMAGYTAERYKDEALREVPEINTVVDTSIYDKISAVLEYILAGEKVTGLENLNHSPVIDTEARHVRTSLATYSCLRITKGCSKHCTCYVVPSLRGVYRSYPVETLVKEAVHMAEEGVRELIPVVQEITRYGMDLHGEKRLPELLRRLCLIEDLQWIQILYCYLEETTDELIQAIAEEKKVCHYLDLSIQHTGSSILKRMGRRTSRRDLEEIIGRLHIAMPDITLRTTPIDGSPGETEEDQDCVLDFMERIHFDHLGVFPYPQEEDAPVAASPDQMPEEIREARRNETMGLQRRISRDNLQYRVDTVLDVFVEGYLPEDDANIERTYMNAPDMDDYLFLPENGTELISGDMVSALATKASEYDLKGVLYEDDPVE